MDPLYRVVIGKGSCMGDSSPGLHISEGGTLDKNRGKSHRALRARILNLQEAPPIKNHHSYIKHMRVAVSYATADCRSL